MPAQTAHADAADRLVAPLMALARAVVPVGGAPGWTEALFSRLTQLILALIRVATLGPRIRRAAAPDTEPVTGAGNDAAPLPTPPLPRARGWLIDALPDVAPSVAAELAALLADPAVAALLEAVPQLRRSLSPVLRSLDLVAPPGSPPPPAPSPPAPSPPAPSPVTPRRPAPRRAPPPPRPPLVAKGRTRPRLPASKTFR